jgi:Core-2/I-Branching enzyme
MIAVVIFCGLCFCGSAATTTSSDDEELTKHQEERLETRVKFELDSIQGDPRTAASYAMEQLTRDLTHRMTRIFEKTKTPECRAMISEHFGYYLQAMAKEKSLPFTDLKFTSSCEGDVEYDFNNLPEGIHMGHIQARTYKPPRNETEYITSAEVVLCYGILAHDSAAATIRLIKAVDEPTTVFVVHIDSKYEETYQTLVEYAKDKTNKIHILGDSYRVRVNWGGFSMVNATLQMLKYADQHVPDFTHFVHMASTSYPIASNRRIRNTLASFPKDANFVHVVLKPTRPGRDVWNYFVECDDRLHRIYQLHPLLKETSGVHMYTASQWFTISKEFAHYLANPEPGTFLHQFLEYIPHVVIADETFFGTVLRNTHFCHKHHNSNFLHLQFDQWENERAIELRDERKCVMPDPNHCGRSPTTMTLDYLDILELTEDLYARKVREELPPVKMYGS